MSTQAMTTARESRNAAPLFGLGETAGMTGRRQQGRADLPDAAHRIGCFGRKALHRQSHAPDRVQPAS